MWRYWRTRGNRLRAGAGNGTCTGTYTNQYQPVTGTPAEHFEVHECIFLWYICIATEGREESAGAPALATGHAPARIPIKSTANYCTGREFWGTSMYNVTSIYVSRSRDEEQVPARRRQLQQ